MGMRRLRIFLGVAIGSLLGCGLMYFGSEALEPYKNDP